MGYERSNLTNSRPVRIGAADQLKEDAASSSFFLSRDSCTSLAILSRYFTNWVRMTAFSFSDALLTWFDQHGRHDLPWQVADDPYAVWVSEIMLQQTQVKTVLQYFERFLQRFPTVQDLGRATWDEVAPYWAGLGYYARARNLHKAAAIVAQQGHFPSTLEQWMALPGIGRSTGGAMMSLGLRQYGVIMDGNVKRVLARFFAIEDDLSKPVHERAMWQRAEQLCPEVRNHDYTQAIMVRCHHLCPQNHSVYTVQCNNIAKHINKV